jgi:hypothetical protein
MIKSFLLGILEFKQSVTTSTRYNCAYEWGRELAHVATFRKLDF